MVYCKYVWICLLWGGVVFCKEIEEVGVTYHATKNDQGAILCSTSIPDRTVEGVRSSVGCSASCSMDTDCTHFNFMSDDQLCQMFHQTSAAELVAQQNCKHYEVLL